jgi:hypothetical protein
MVLIGRVLSAGRPVVRSAGAVAEHVIVSLDAPPFLAERFSARATVRINPPSIGLVSVHTLVAAEILVVALDVGGVFFLRLATVSTLDLDVANQRLAVSVLVVNLHRSVAVESSITSTVWAEEFAPSITFFGE